MKISRRDLLIGGAGLTAGFFFTPVPWKLLSDTATWTQNWPWIPQAVRGPIETKHSFCTLCLAGCGVRVRIAGGFPVGVAGLKSDPRTRGALCPLGFAAQQLNWQQPLREVRYRDRAASWAEAQTAFQRACTEGSVTIFDARPGRAASTIFRDFCAAHGGNYSAVLSSESRALQSYAEWSGVPVNALGYDLENTGTILSFSAPLLDGWGTPGRFTRLWSERGAGADPRLRLIQIDSSLSRTAALAWRWILVPEGSHAALAAGIAQVLLEERLVKPNGPIPHMSLADAALKTGLTVQTIRDLARTLVQKMPALVIAAEMNPAAAALNVLLGAVGTRGGILQKAPPEKRQAHADKSAPPRAVLVDSTVPWEFVPPANAEVFRFAAWDGGGSKADWLLPAPRFVEELTDVPTAPTSGVETYAIAESLTPAPANIMSAAQFLAKVDPALPGIERVIHERCEALFHGRRGTLAQDRTVPISEIDSAQKLEETLRQGAVWVGDPLRSGGLRCELKEWPAESAVPAAAHWMTPWSPPVLPALSTKLYQESELRERPQGS